MTNVFNKGAAPESLSMRKKGPGGMILTYILLALWAVTTIFPFIWVIINSFKDKNLIRHEAFSIPTGEKFTLENFSTAWERVDILGGFIRSLIASSMPSVVRFWRI